MLGVLVAVGYIVSLVGGIMFLIVAFKESALWGLGCLFIPLVSLFFLISHWKDAKKAFLIQMIGAVIIILTVLMQGSGQA